MGLLRNVLGRVCNFFRGPVGIPGMPGHDACDIRCPHCYTWLSSLDVDQRPKAEFTVPSKNPAYQQYQGYYATYTCGACEENSDWFTGAPVLILADSVKITILKPQEPSCPSQQG